MRLMISGPSPAMLSPPPGRISALPPDFPGLFSRQNEVQPLKELLRSIRVSEAIVDTRELRNAFGCYATEITVVTALDEKGNAVGITANSFSSLSLDPPLVLWCLDRRSATFDVFNACQTFVVTVLDANGAP